MADPIFEEMELEANGYTHICNRNGIEIFRKVIDGHGYWKAIVEGDIIDITYEQAIGYEGITPVEKISKFLGRKLLPN